MRKEDLVVLGLVGLGLLLARKKERKPRTYPEWLYEMSKLTWPPEVAEQVNRYIEEVKRKLEGVRVETQPPPPGATAGVYEVPPEEVVGRWVE